MVTIDLASSLSWGHDGTQGEVFGERSRQPTIWLKQPITDPQPEDKAQFCGGLGLEVRREKLNPKVEIDVRRQAHQGAGSEAGGQQVVAFGGVGSVGVA